MGNDGKDTYKFYLTDVNFGDGFFKLTGGCEIKFEANPNAPKDIEGSYTLTINGRTVTLSDGKDKVEATCYYEDNFDIGEGVRQCFEKLKEARKEIKVGDIVEVVNSGCCYTTHTSYFKQFDIIPIEYCINYRYGELAKDGAKGKVVFIKNGLAVIVTDMIDDAGFEYDDAVYLISLSGLRKVVD